MHKTFQVLLIAFLIIFTAAGLVLFVSPIASLFWSTGAGGIDSHGIVAIGGGVSNRVFNVALAVVILITIAAIYLVLRRTKLR